MGIRNVAVVIFFDKNLNIIVQDRRGVSKLGERYGFWGGEIEEGEKPQQALKRELLEELEIIPEKITYWGKFSYFVRKEGEYKGWLINAHTFLSPITKKVEQAHVHEGGGMIKMSFEQVLVGEGFPEESTKFLKELPDFLESNLLKSPR